MRQQRISAMFAAVVAVLLSFVSTASAHAAAPADYKVAAVLAQAGTLVVGAAPTVSDGDSAAQNDSVDVPFDPAKGVALKTSDGQTVTVGLPNADKLGRGVKLSSGAVLFRGSNGADAVVVPSASGAQFLTIINGKQAPPDYAYPAAVPQGGSISIGSDGSAVILDANGKPVARIAKAWAFDANGATVDSRFTADGSTLTQHIAHRDAEVAYPVLADPNVTFAAISFTLWYGKQEVKDLSGQFWGNLMTAVAGAACGKVKPFVLQAGCAAVIASAWFWIDHTFDDAAANNQCVWITVSYGGDLDSWGRYGC